MKKLTGIPDAIDGQTNYIESNYIRYLVTTNLANLSENCKQVSAFAVLDKRERPKLM